MSWGATTVKVAGQSFAPPSNFPSTLIVYVQPLPVPLRSARNMMSWLCEPGPTIVGLWLMGGVASTGVWPDPTMSAGSLDVVVVLKLYGVGGLSVAVIVTVRHLWFGGPSFFAP